MAQNLNYITDNSYCYDDNPSNCTKYGRLYTWADATTACPTGWHLPTYDEWKTLFAAVGGLSTAGAKLNARTGWPAYDDIPNEDAYGFAALPAGYRSSGGGFYSAGSYAAFWSATEGNSNYAYGMYPGYFSDSATLSNLSKYYGFSVRCVKD